MKIVRRRCLLNHAILLAATYGAIVGLPRAAEATGAASVSCARVGFSIVPWVREEEPQGSNLAGYTLGTPARSKWTFDGVPVATANIGEVRFGHTVALQAALPALAGGRPTVPKWKERSGVHDAAILGGDQRQCGADLRGANTWPFTAVGIVRMSDGRVCAGFVSWWNQVTTSGHCFRPKNQPCGPTVSTPVSFDFPGSRESYRVRLAHNNLVSGSNSDGNDWAVLVIDGIFPQSRGPLWRAGMDARQIRDRFRNGQVTPGDAVMLSFDDYTASVPRLCGHFYSEKTPRATQTTDPRFGPEDTRSCLSRSIGSDPNAPSADCDVRGSSGAPFLMRIPLSNGQTDWAAVAIMKGDSGEGADVGRQHWPFYGPARPS